MDALHGKQGKWILIGIDFVAAILLIVLDQITKKIAVSKLKGNQAVPIWKNVFELDYVENHGSAFGLFQNQKVFLLIVGVVFMAIMIYVLWKTPAKKRFWPIHALVAGIIAGGLGNMIDRMTLGYVVDFFSFVLIHFPVFNVADVYIVISTFCLAICLIFVYQEEELDFFWKK